MGMMNKSEIAGFMDMSGVLTKDDVLNGMRESYSDISVDSVTGVYTGLLDFVQADFGKAGDWRGHDILLPLIRVYMQYNQEAFRKKSTEIADRPANAARMLMSSTDIVSDCEFLRSQFYRTVAEMALCDGDEFSIAFLQAVIKRCYKQDYDVIKRYACLKSSDIMSLLDNKDVLAVGIAIDPRSLLHLSRYIFIALILNIPFDADRDMWLNVLTYCAKQIDDSQEDQVKDFNPDRVYFDWDIPAEQEWYNALSAEERYNVCVAAMRRIFGDVVENEDKEPKRVNYRISVASSKYLQHMMSVFHHGSYANIFANAYTCTSDEMQLYFNVYHHLYSVWPRDKVESLTKKEIRQYALMYIMAMSHSTRARTFDLSFLYFFTNSYTIADKGLEVALNEINDFANKKNSQAKQEEKVPVETETVTVENSDDASEESEVDILKRRIQELEQKNSDLAAKNATVSDLYKSLKTSYDDMVAEKDAKISELEQDLDSWVSYDALTNQDTDEEVVQLNVDGISVDEMSAEICNHKVVIVAGNENWTKRIRNMFPKWNVIERTAFSTFNAKSVANAEYVAFCSDRMSHAMWFRFYNVVKASGIPYGFIHSTNMDLCIRMVYADICRLKGEN